MRNLIFFPKIPPISKLEVGFFSTKKNFSKIFQHTAYFFCLNFISKKKTKKSENLFRSVGRAVGRSLITTASRRVSGEGRRSYAHPASAQNVQD